MRHLIAVAFIAALAACGGGETKQEPTTPPATEQPPPGIDEPAPAERPEMTVEECEAVGTVVGDIGDGAVHRPDYRCPDGAEPVGRVPSGIEGAVCCPASDGR